MKLIPLTQGKSAIVDDEDYSDLIKYKWQYNNGYAKRGINTIRMARQIMNATPLQEVDHINRNKLDNRRENLRIVTRGQNVRNIFKRKDSPNKFKGIHYIKAKNKWIARIQINGKRISSGYFLTEEEAAKRYDELAKKYHKEFASLNFLS